MLAFVAGPELGRQVRLTADSYTLGRRTDCEIFIPDMRVSRHHARVFRDGASWFVEDLGSNNGTFLNNVRLASRRELGSGALLRIGQHVLEFRVRTVQPEPGPRTLVGERADAEITTGTATPSSLMGYFSNVPNLERRMRVLTALLEASAHTADLASLWQTLGEQLALMWPDSVHVAIMVREADEALQVKFQRNLGTAELVLPSHLPGYLATNPQAVLLTDSGLGRSPAGYAIAAPLRITVAGDAPAHASVGIIYIEAPAPHFRDVDVELLQSISAHASLAMSALRMQHDLGRQKRMELDLAMARQIQRSLLPKSPPHVVGLEFAVHYEPAYQVGGDFYDFIWLDETTLAFMVGDVAGKAVAAAIYMARLTSEIRSRAGIARSPARLVARVNKEMFALGEDGMFATLLYGTYDLTTRTMVFTNAGHCLPLLKRGDRVFSLESERAQVPPLGVMPDPEVGEARVTLELGDMVFLVTDGILEAENEPGSYYGLRRLVRRIASARGNVEEVANAVLQDMDSFTRQRAARDDVTLLGMSVGDRRARRQTDTLPGLVQGSPGDNIAPSDQK